MRQVLFGRFGNIIQQSNGYSLKPACFASSDLVQFRHNLAPQGDDIGFETDTPT